MLNLIHAPTDHLEPVPRPPANILLVVHGYPPHQSGGAEAQAQRKARWWAKRGDTVRVLAADPGIENAPPFGVIERIDDTDGEISIRRLRFRVPDGTQSFRDTFRNRLLAPEIEQELRNFRPDLLYEVSGYLFGTLPLELAARNGIPSVLFAVDFWHECPRLTLLRPDGSICPGPRYPADCAACRLSDRNLTRHLPLAWKMAATSSRLPILKDLGGISSFEDRQQAITAALSSVALVIVNAEFTAERLRRRGVDNHRLLVVRQGLDVDQTPRPIRKRCDDNALRVLYLGQLAAHKGVDLVVRAVQTVADEHLPIRLRVHGQQTGGVDYVERLRTLGDSPAIEIGESLGPAEVLSALRDSDVLVVPSRWYENSPNVILEAFAAGVPVIVAGHGGMAELVRDGVDGLHVRPDDLPSLTAALRRLTCEPLLLTRLRAGVRPPATVDHEMEAEEVALTRVLQSRS